MPRLRIGWPALLALVVVTTPTRAALPELIAFSANGRAKGWQVYTVTPDGLTVAQVTSGTPQMAFDPDWSPDGSQLAFTLSRGAFHGIAVARRDGTGERLLGAPKRFDSGPAWSPDGRQIAFVRSMPGFDQRIHLMSADGNDVVDLTDRQALEGSPEWHPSGRSLLFPDSATNTLVKLSLEDGERETIAVATAWARWSPDGARIAANIGWDVYLMDEDGDNPRRLTRHAAHDYGPSWSPDGERLVFTSARDGWPQTYIIDADGKNERRLVDNPSIDEGPVWRGPRGLAVTARRRQSIMWGWLKSVAATTR